MISPLALLPFWRLVLVIVKICLLCIFDRYWVLLNSLKNIKMMKKKLKTAEKSVLTSFWMRAAPKSWLKYTTFVTDLTLYIMLAQLTSLLSG